MTPAWLLDIFAAGMLILAAVCAARLVAARSRPRGSVAADIDVALLLTAIAMAGMLTPGLRTLPNVSWDVVFGGLTAWFAGRLVADVRAYGARALSADGAGPHLVNCGAMLYMFLAAATVVAGRGMAGMGGMGMSSIGVPSGSMLMLSTPTITLAFPFALILIGYTIWDLNQLPGRRFSRIGPRVSPSGVVAQAAVPAMAGAESPAAGFAAPQLAMEPAVVGSGADPVAVDQPAVDHAVAGSAAGSAPAGRLGPAGRFLLSGAVTTGSRVAMGLTMAFMLLIMI